MPNIAPDRIVGTITREILAAEIGRNLAHSALARMKRGADLLIPDLEGVRRGDIILSRHCGWRENVKLSLVARAQKSLFSKNFTPEACSWGHAMVYLGDMFVAESQPIFFRGPLPASGLRAIPLTAHSASRELLICRHRGAAGREENIARYAALNCIANSRRYPIDRVLRTAFLDRSETKQLFIAANCSEFALECLAVGARCMVETYAKVRSGQEDFYPADFHADSDFERIEMTYLRLVD
ncbi:MAG TPA: hypothetical protein VIG55_07335 [Methylosinus sp.]